MSLEQKNGEQAWRKFVTDDLTIFVIFFDLKLHESPVFS